MKGTEYPGGKLERLFAEMRKLQARIDEKLRKVALYQRIAKLRGYGRTQICIADEVDGENRLIKNYLNALVQEDLSAVDQALINVIGKLSRPLDEWAEAFAELADLAVAEDAPKRKKFPRPAAVIGPRPRTTVPSRYLAQARRCKRMPRAGMKCHR